MSTHDLEMEPVEVPDSLGQRFQRYASLTAEKRRLKDELSTVEQQLRGLEDVLVEQMAEHGMQNTTVDGYCIYQQHQVWAARKEGVEAAQVVDALRKSGLEGMISVNTQSLSAYLRECREEGRELPEALANVVEAKEVTKLAARKA